MRLCVLLVTAPLGLLACASMALRPTADPWVPAPAPAVAHGSPEREACSERHPLRQAWFGDLHVHTAYSFDARSRDMLSTPDDAYRFARGEQIGLGPFDIDRKGSRAAQLERPLDFAAVTDHAEWIGEVTLCSTPGSSVYDTKSCRSFRGEIGPVGLISMIPGVGGGRMMGILGVGGRKGDVCGEAAIRCRESLASAWQATQRATERHNDSTSSCSFTSFHAYEYSNSPGVSKVHRNIIFRSDIVPELPVSSLEEPDPVGLWERLDELCNQTGSGCEALAIPHNPNMSNGRMFSVPYRGEDFEEQQRQARLRARMEPVVEMMQVKGESECTDGMFGVVGEDELCGFEKARGFGDDDRYPDCEEGIGTGAMRGRGCESRLDFARYALIEGLREQQRIGVNPYQFGFIGSTDTHNATPGDVEEYSYQGCCASNDASAAARLSSQPEFAGQPSGRRNPGGLMGVWSEQNERSSIFDAIQRRETFATSGPRITPRFFAGWEVPDDLCGRADLVERGYGDGVPMGGVLGPQGGNGSSPVFVASALRDPGARDHPGGALQRLQIVKVWLGDDGLFHQAVHDIAGDPDNGAHVDLDTCEVRGVGADDLCASWRDPDFDASRSAAYYARVVENPSCRWTWRECLAQPQDAQHGTCLDPTIPKTIQERAWTSPIWFEAGVESLASAESLR